MQKAGEATSLTLKSWSFKTYDSVLMLLMWKTEMLTGTVWSFIIKHWMQKEPDMYLSLGGTMQGICGCCWSKDAGGWIRPRNRKNEQGLLLENVVTSSCISVPYYEEWNLKGVVRQTRQLHSLYLCGVILMVSCPVDGKGVFIKVHLNSKGKARWCGAEIRNNRFTLQLSQNGTKAWDKVRISGWCIQKYL